MAVFDIERNDLLRLSAEQLEELVARLAEAEVAAHGYSPAYVNWSGSINAPDSGIDIHVKIPSEQSIKGYLERPNTIFQAKIPSMPASDINKEMMQDGVLSSTISEQVALNGSYIIVSLKDDCSPPIRQARIRAMQAAVKDEPNSDKVHLDFYDRSKLTQWLRQHPSVMLWVKREIGQGYSGWQPYGAWSNPPKCSVDNFIIAPGVTVTLPSGGKHRIEDALEPMRELIRSTNKAVRITGLSGVGKTRIVQALFDEAIGANPLDRTTVIYADTGDAPNPSAMAMLERLITENQHAVMVLDNCPPELHSSLASKVSAAGIEVKLITIEYDIKEDKPQLTEVIHIETTGLELAEQLLSHRLPNLGQNNARHIAEFAGGNARVALAIAERVEDGESLAQLSDEQLFNRLFVQRNQPDRELRQQAEVLSLVYSFSVSAPETGINELEVLGKIFGHTRTQLHSSVQQLLERQIIQRRADWRAVLPHAIANRLASSALNSIPTVELRNVFETKGRERLLTSFAHRLGLLHEHPVAKDIVEAWFQPNGLLKRLSNLDDIETRVLNYIAPTAPESLLLDWIETDLIDFSYQYEPQSSSPKRELVLKLLQLLAYEPSAFERCTSLLIRLAQHENESNDYDTARNRLTRFFQAYLSGTHASVKQRIAIVNECISSGSANLKTLGFNMLSTALDGRATWVMFGMNEFGARSRDFGFHPSSDELVEWYSAFVDVAVQLGNSGELELEEPARRILADKLRELWSQGTLAEKLVKAARDLHTHHPWFEGWQAIRTIVYFDYSGRSQDGILEELPDSLTILNNELKPDDLISLIMTYVLSSEPFSCIFNTDSRYGDSRGYEQAAMQRADKAVQLGKEFSESGHKLSELGGKLFAGIGSPFCSAFGRGLAQGSQDLKVCWQQLSEHLERHCENSNDFAIFAGFIEEVCSIESDLAYELLDQCAEHKLLKHALVGLHPKLKAFTESDLNRCTSLLDETDISPWMYESILWREEYDSLPKALIVELAQRLLLKSNGDDVVLHALSMRLHGKDADVDTLGLELRHMGLRAAIQRIQRSPSGNTESMNYHMEIVISSALRFQGNDAEKLEWLDTIFSIIDRTYGNLYSFETTIETTAELMTEEFLERIFEGTVEQQRRNLSFIRYNDMYRSPFAKIDIDILIQWCCAQNNSGVWPVVAMGIKLWSKEEKQNAVLLSEAAIKLLEAAPKAEEILAVYAERVTPSSWSGSRSHVMQPRADAISKLFKHKRVDISVAARAFCAPLEKLIAQEIKREQQEGVEQEQRFE